jgi:peptide-methionine (S)-S-oxide reductase
MFSQKPATQMNPESALEGRAEPIEVEADHVVLGTPIVGPWPEGHEAISFGMGCFWGAERIFWQIPGVYTTAVGYQGGYTPNPDYREVCTGRTGHAEVALVVYDPEQVELETLLKEFWEQHDPTTLNRQGNDVGTQYRSAIYPTTPEQRAIAEESLERYQERLTAQGYGSITTEVTDASEAGPFYYAEDYHQGYLHKNPMGYCNHGYCQVSYGS